MVRPSARVTNRSEAARILLSSAEGRRRVDATLNADDITLASLMGPLVDRRFSAASAAEAVLGQQSPWPDEPFNAAVLDAFEGQIRLSSKRLTLTEGMALERAKVNVALQPGRVDVTEISGSAPGGDIKAMLRAALQPNVQASAAPKYKRPFHHFISALRALPATVNATSSLRNQLNAAGHRPFYWGPPDGYPDTLAYWSGLVIPRWNFGASLMASQLAGATRPMRTLSGCSPSSGRHASAAWPGKVSWTRRSAPPVTDASSALAARASVSRSSPRDEGRGENCMAGAFRNRDHRVCGDLCRGRRRGDHEPGREASEGV